METSPATAIARAVRSEMSAQRVTLAELATRTGIPYTSLHRRLTVTGRGITMDELADIAAALGTTMSVLVAAAEDQAA